MGPGSLRLELTSSDDPRDGVVVALEGYHGPDACALDDTARRFIHVTDGVRLTDCSGPNDVGKRVTAGDPSCPSPACAVRVTDDAPGAPFPRELTFAVRCEGLCENGGDAVCAGPFDFVTRVECR